MSKKAPNKSNISTELTFAPLLIWSEAPDMKLHSKHLATFIKAVYIFLFLLACIWFAIAQHTLPSEQNPRDYFVTSFDEGWVWV